ncbi:UNVERIFIED_CONTAM: hypothetical protein Slati_2987900 [Sesamum latifolium]|uniref:Endonuclease/exonuclease/phosphatase domain-containing protein n=1 Tax=Sesamum latifolium TaxID=2727402 RepID=A0AAW2VIF3_9LAMI
MSFSCNHIYARVSNWNLEKPCGRFTGFYRGPKTSNRPASWDLLRRVGDLLNFPWICAGDFNAILTDSEKDGSAPTQQRQLRGFREALNDSGLYDCDHYPILFERRPSTRKGAYQANRPLRFEALWIKSKTCDSNLWGYFSAKDLCSTLMAELENCKFGLLRWSKDEFGDISGKINWLEKEIDSLQKSNLSGASRTRLSEIRTELVRLVSAEEIKWKQRGKSAWLAKGDRNTMFFHAEASQW